MGYYMRYFVTGAEAITLDPLQAALRVVDPAYTLVPDGQLSDLGDLFYGDIRLAQIEINLPAEEIFQDDVAEFLDLVGPGTDPASERVRAVLQSARAILAVEAFWQGNKAEPVLAKLDPLWDWLFAHVPGLSQADGEGFYDANGLILERNFTL